jgi:Ca2+-binding RTX toxin-like protein
VGVNGKTEHGAAGPSFVATIAGSVGGVDTITGGPGADVGIGGPGVDAISGGPGTNLVIQGNGSATFAGGSVVSHTGS